EK
ncbi:hypothetical protein D047_4911B, partial [Vibrio parahaemolyticus VPTS-2010_2]